MVDEALVVVVILDDEVELDDILSAVIMKFCLEVIQLQFELDEVVDVVVIVDVIEEIVHSTD